MVRQKLHKNLSYWVFWLAELQDVHAGTWLLRLVGVLLGLCGLAAEDAIQDGRSALEGDCGPLSLPSDWSQGGSAAHKGAGPDLAGLASEEAVLACGLLLQAETIAAAAKVGAPSLLILMVQRRAC